MTQYTCYAEFPAKSQQNDGLSKQQLKDSLQKEIWNNAHLANVQFKRSVGAIGSKKKVSGQKRDSVLNGV